VKSPEGVIPINTATNTAGQLIKISSPEDAVWPMETLISARRGKTVYVISQNRGG
jgi:hypothetical protein